MGTTFKVLTIAIIYNEEGKFLVTRRSSKEGHEPGIYSYPGGQVEYDGTEVLNHLELNAKREAKEETDLDVEIEDYINSHAFKKKSGDNITAVAFLAKHISGEAKAVDPEEVSEVSWMSLEEIKQLDTLEIVKTVYTQAAAKLEERRKLHNLLVAGIVINENDEFLLVRGINKDTQNPAQFSFPYAALAADGESSWEKLEQGVSKVVFDQTGVEIADGPIPFTDQSFYGKDHFETVIEFFICRYQYGRPQVKDPSTISEVVWKKFEDFNRDDFSPSIYLVFEKADKFLKSLT